jgi:hypothetical protein
MPFSFPRKIADADALSAEEITIRRAGVVLLVALLGWIGLLAWLLVGL